MKAYNYNFASLDELRESLDLSKINPKKTLIQIFSGLISEYEIKQIKSIIQQKNSDAIFIGTTTAGEINEGAISENSITISIIEFEYTTVESNYFIDNDDYQAGINLAKKLFNNKTKVVILFIDGLLTNGNDVIDGISSINKTIPIAGGMSGDNGAFTKTFIFNNDGIYSKGVVAAAMNSSKLRVFTDYHLNWQAIGDFLTVTKVEKNRLYEINNIPASDIYRKYLGKKVGDGLPYSATEFPLLKIEKDGQQICRTFIDKFDDGSLLTIGNLEVGDKVKLAFGNINSVLSKVKNSYYNYLKFQPEAIYTYSCTARKAFLQSEITAELKPLNSICTMSGFFTYGEIFHSNNKNSLLNISLTILGMSETQQIKKSLSKLDNKKHQLEKNFLKDKHFLVLDALTHLSNTVIDELNDSKKALELAQTKLEDQANRDYLTNLYNRRYFNRVAQDFINIAKRERKQFSVIMLDIDKFKRINDQYGHSVGDKVITLLASILVQHTRDSDIVSRFGGEEFALLLPFTDKKGALKIAENLRSLVQNQSLIVDGYTIQFTISLGVACVNKNTSVNISDALDRADQSLYMAKKNGRNMVV